MTFQKKPLKTRQELANELGISYKTLFRKIQQAKLHISPGLLTLKEQIQIIMLFMPEDQIRDEKEE